LTRPAQLRLNFDLRPALGGEDFLVAPNNCDAVAWLDRWPDWPSPVLTIYGPPGCGKSHLMQVFLAAGGVTKIGASELGTTEPHALLADARACAIDGVEAVLAAGRERELLHLYNVAAETGRKLLLTAHTAPVTWPLSIADLRSRMGAGVAVEIGAPDDPLVAAVLVKLFADRQLRVDGGVVTFLLSRMERSFDAARRMVAAIDEAAMAERRNITVPLVRKVLASVQPP